MPLAIEQLTSRMRVGHALLGRHGQGVAPQRYYTIPHVEDRLFVPPEFLPLFQRNGWELQSDGGVFLR